MVSYDIVRGCFTLFVKSLACKKCAKHILCSIKRKVFIMLKTFEIKKIVLGAGIPKVCIPLMGKTDEEIIAEAEKIASVKGTNIDMVEFRGDYYQDLGDMNKLSAVLSKLQSIFKDKILLFTIRSKKEGGEKLSFTTPTVNDINVYVVKNKLADMVDVELFSGEDAIAEIVQASKQSGVKIIMSNHDFNATPAKDIIIERLTRMQELGADIAKIAVMPQSKQDVITLQDALCHILESEGTTPLVGISMGKLGAISRIAAQAFGSAMTFATFGKASAPGQIPVEDLNQALSIINQYTS